MSNDRREFEAWAKARCGIVDFRWNDILDRYWEDLTEGAYLSWQAHAGSVAPPKDEHKPIDPKQDAVIARTYVSVPKDMLCHKCGSKEPWKDDINAITIPKAESLSGAAPTKEVCPKCGQQDLPHSLRPIVCSDPWHDSCPNMYHSALENLLWAAKRISESKPVRNLDEIFSFADSTLRAPSLEKAQGELIRKCAELAFDADTNYDARDSILDLLPNEEQERKR